LRFYLHTLTFLVFLGLWTWKLLEPHPVPEELSEGLAALELNYLAAKSLHAGGYAFLTVLAGTLPVPQRWRYFLIGLLICHGVASEIGQYLMEVGRTGRVSDVLIDWVGITAGVLVIRWWDRRKPTTSR
jgi:VanZ family protein